MPVTQVEGSAQLAVAPGNSGQASLEGGDGQFHAAALDLRREVETDRFRVGRQFGQPLAAQPGREHFPVGGVGAPGVVGLGRARVGLGGLGQGCELSAQARGGQGRGVFAQSRRARGSAFRRSSPRPAKNSSARNACSGPDRAAVPGRPPTRSLERRAGRAGGRRAAFRRLVGLEIALRRGVRASRGPLRA